jgi:hypothetical protein
MNTEPTIQETSVDIDAYNLMGHLGEMSKKIEEIREMIETIRQANRKGYSNIVQDHAARIIPRIDDIYLRAQVAMMDAEKLAK